MGICLIVFGVVLFVSQFRGKEAFDTLIDWWPIVFVLLGLELLVYLAVSRNNESRVRYDVFSILFVGVLCMVGLGGAIMTSTGILQEIRHAVSAVERSEHIQEIAHQVPESVARIVVQNRAGSDLLVDVSAEPSVHVFGQYRYTDYGDTPSGVTSAQEQIQFRTIGDTMYIDIHPLERHLGIRPNATRMLLTLVLPEHAESEIIGDHRLL